MFRLLNIEFHKLKHNRASKVLIIIYFGLLTSIALITFVKFKFAATDFNISEIGIFNFPYIWHFGTYIASGFKFFLLLVIVSMMANEYSNKTLKQNLIDGLSKKEFILSKFYTIVVFALISTLFVFITALILGLLYSDFNELSIIFSELHYLFAYFLKLVAFFSFGIFMGVLVKRSAFAVGGILIWWFIEGIIKLLLFWKIPESDTKETIMQFFPLESMSNIIKEPFSKINTVQTVAKQVGESFVKDYSVQFTDIIIVSIWTFIFIYSSYHLLKKRDL
jgi:ABC-type transport system involved in multi-copper enzyme maturation permease subunit